MKIVDIAEITKPIASAIANAYIDFSKMYRPQLVRHLIACYAARTAGESWFCRTAAGVWNPCRSMSQVVL